MLARESYRVKASCFFAARNAGGRYSLLEDVLVVLLFMAGFQVKTFVHLDSTAATRSIIPPLGGVVMELRWDRV